MNPMDIPGPATPDQRKAALAQVISREVASGGWRVESQSEYQAILVKGKKINHVLHLILTILTAGLWALVWLVLYLMNMRKTLILTVDDYGNVRQES